MKHLQTIDHIGYAVRDIMTTAQHYLDAGWTMSDIFEERVQNARIAFLYREGFTTIELVSPLEGKSPVDGTLEKSGVAPYHICYVVDDVMEAAEDLCEEGFRPLFMPVPSVAMENRTICYLMHLDVGVIELVSKKV